MCVRVRVWARERDGIHCGFFLIYNSLSVYWRHSLLHIYIHIYNFNEVDAMLMAEKKFPIN